MAFTASEAEFVCANISSLTSEASEAMIIKRLTYYYSSKRAVASQPLMRLQGPGC